MQSGFLLPYVISNLVGLILLGLSMRYTRLTRLLFFLLFAGSCWVNLRTALYTPDLYLTYADTAIGPYRKLILGWFGDHIHILVPAIAAGQGAIAIGLLLRGVWVRLALAGMILFLLAIAPLGLGSAFPFSITVSLAAIAVWRIDRHEYLWRKPGALQAART